jgi:hypothetical protein
MPLRTRRFTFFGRDAAYAMNSSLQHTPQQNSFHNTIVIYCVQHAKGATLHTP